MAETDVHRKQMINVLECLEERYRSDPDVYVTGNIFLYFVNDEGERQPISPDIFVVWGVEKKDRRIYNLEVEGKAPDVVIELTSRHTKVEDLGNKKVIYANLGVREYFLNRLLGNQARIYVTEETLAVIHRIPSRSRSALAAEFLRLEKGKYLKRWARRLQGFGFSAEDARVLSYASFGLDRQAKQLGVEMVITADRKLVERFLQHRPAIARRFHAMTVQLRPPCHDAHLPAIILV